MTHNDILAAMARGARLILYQRRTMRPGVVRRQRAVLIAGRSRWDIDLDTRRDLWTRHYIQVAAVRAGETEYALTDRGLELAVPLLEGTPSRAGTAR